MKFYVYAELKNKTEKYFTVNAVSLNNAVNKAGIIGEKRGFDCIRTTVSVKEIYGYNLDEYNVTMNNNFETRGNILTIKGV